MSGQTNEKSFNATNFVRENLFNFVNFVVLIAGFAYYQGQLSTKMSATEARLVTLEKDSQNQIIYGHPDHERRIALLETRNDQFTKLVSVSEQQAKSIDVLGEMVSKDHDVLIRLASAMEQKTK